MAERQIPGPPVNPETQEWWDACKEGKFLIPKDNSNGELFWYPRKRACPAEQPAIPALRPD